MVALCALVSGLDAELVRLGYKDSTMVWYRGCWRRLQKYFAACGFFGKEQSGTLRPNDIYLFRVAQMLGEYAVHGAVLRRYSRSVSKLSGTAPRRSRGSRRRFARLIAPCRRCAHTGRWPGSSSPSPAHAAGWPPVTAPRSGRSS